MVYNSGLTSVVHISTTEVWRPQAQRLAKSRDLGVANGSNSSYDKQADNKRIGFCHGGASLTDSDITKSGRLVFVFVYHQMLRILFQRV